MTDNKFDNPYSDFNNQSYQPQQPANVEADGVFTQQEATNQPGENPQTLPLNSESAAATPAAQVLESPYSCEWNGSVGENTQQMPTQQATPYTPSPDLISKQAPKRERRGVSKGLFFAGIAICLCLSFIAGFAGTGLYNYLSSMNTEIKNGITINKVDTPAGNAAYSGDGLSTVEIVNKVGDSVVEITTETVTTGIFAQQFIDSGAGSGVIVDADGYIVTNHHVIDGATKISVTLRDGTTYEAELVGSDADLDVAVLKITPDKKLVEATFGDSDALMVGQRTVAIGNPLGQLGGSVTEGILSALDRDVLIDGKTMSLMQTDTAINPGNSGGGLFDQNGNLIGIVNAKSSGSEIEGLGFAIPVNDVVNVIGDLTEFGYVRGRVSLGVTFVDVKSEQVAWMYDLEKTGCYVYSVEKNTNADVAGLESGDRVISINGKDIETSDDVKKIIRDCKVGEEITFKVENRSGKTYTVSFELEEYVPEEENENFFENKNNYSDFSDWWSYN